MGKSAQSSLCLPLSVPGWLFSRMPFWTFGMAEAAASHCHQPISLYCCNKLTKCGFLGILFGVLCWFFLLFEKSSVTFHICCSRPCKCSSHHFDPGVLYQCGCVLCCDIPGGNNPGCLTPPQHEKDRVGWQVRVEAFPVWFWDVFTQICGSLVSKWAICGSLQFLLLMASCGRYCLCGAGVRAGLQKGSSCRCSAVYEMEEFFRFCQNICVE